MIKKFIKTSGIIITGVAVLLTLFINAKLFYTPSFIQTEGISLNNDLVKQLQYLKTEMHNDAAGKMQQYYPEGFVFTQVVYGLSWSALADVMPANTTLYKEASAEMNWCYENIQSAKGKEPFDKSLPIPYGAFYTGWSNYLLGRKLKAANLTEGDSIEIKNFKTSCQQINNSICKTLYPESYSGYAWPADVFVAVACLSLHDKIFKPLYQQTIHDWLVQVKLHLDENGFIPYAAAADGTVKEKARGSSESLILTFLYDMDSSFANQQFKLYQQKFIDYRFGLPGIREFPKGSDSKGNIDSGPVLLGIGSAATIAGLKVLLKYGDSVNAVALRNSLEGFGLAYEDKNTKKYLLGKWPMADVFLAWAHSEEIQKDSVPAASLQWRITFQLYSVVLLIVFAGCIMVIIKKK